jgi:ABC-type uncharacterized transport system substrate-binding protein
MLLTWLALSSHATYSEAAPPHVTIVVSSRSPAYAEFVAGVKEKLSPGTEVLVLNKESFADPNAPISSTDVVVAAGRAAAEAVADSDTVAVPVLNALLSQNAFRRLGNQFRAGEGSSTYSAIYLEPPLARALELIRVALPGRSRVGVVLGPESRGLLRTLGKLAHERKLELHAQTIVSRSELFSALRSVLAESDVLLAIPDPMVLNPETLPSVLMTAYHHRVPVVAFSAAEVDAGALIAVHSSPRQVGMQAAEILNQMTGAASPLPRPQEPKYLSVQVNPHVARSLAIEIAPESELENLLTKTMTKP